MFVIQSTIHYDGKIKVKLKIWIIMFNTIYINKYIKHR